MNLLTLLLYLILFLIIVIILWVRKPHWIVTVLTLMFCFGIGLLGIYRYTLPHFPFPEATGSYDVGVTTFEHNEMVRALVWYPAEATAAQSRYGYLSHFDRPLLGLPPLVYGRLTGRPTAAYQDAIAVDDQFPVVLYTHGADGFTEENTFLLTELASHGYVVISVVHAKSVSDYELNLQRLGSEPELFLETMKTAVMPDRLVELTWIIDQLPQLNQTDPLFQGRLDLSAINFIGYSLGGGVVSDYCALHENCTAVLNLDGNPFMTAHEHGVSAPYLHISQHAFLKLAAQSAPDSPTNQMATLYQNEVAQVIHHTKQNGQPAKWLLLQDSGHGSFTDMAYWIGPRWGFLQTFLGTVKTEASQGAIRHLAVQFLQNPENIEATPLHTNLIVDFPR